MSNPCMHARSGNTFRSNVASAIRGNARPTDRHGRSSLRALISAWSATSRIGMVQCNAWAYTPVHGNFVQVGRNLARDRRRFQTSPESNDSRQTGRNEETSTVLPKRFHSSNLFWRVEIVWSSQWPVPPPPVRERKNPKLARHWNNFPRSSLDVLVPGSVFLVGRGALPPPPTTKEDGTWSVNELGYSLENTPLCNASSVTSRKTPRVVTIALADQELVWNHFVTTFTVLHHHRSPTLARSVYRHGHSCACMQCPWRMVATRNQRVARIVTHPSSMCRPMWNRIAVGD